MIKKVVITLAVLISIFLMFFISLSNGIRLGDFDYNNVNIQGLYLKYDKKLIVGTESITIFNDNRTKSGTFRLKFSIEPFFDKYFVGVEQFLMMDPYLNISGNIILDLDNIDLDNISQTYINNFKIQFHQNLKSVHADKCFVKYSNNNFYFSFENPTYATIKLDNSKVVIEDYELLKLELKSTDMINTDLLSLLSNYEIDLPLTQSYGENTTTVKLDIPFDIKKDIKAYSEITVKDGKINIYDIPVYVQKMQLTLKDNKLSAKGKLLKKLKDYELEYDIDTDFIIDFTTSKLLGNFILNEGKFQKLSTQNAKGEFNFDFENSFQASVVIDPKTKIKVDEEDFTVKKANTIYMDKDQAFRSSISLNHITYPLKINIEDVFDIQSNSSKGKGEVLLNNENDVLFTETLNYQTNFDKNFKLFFDVDTLQWFHNEMSYIVKNGSGEYRDGKVFSNLKSIQSLENENLIDNLNLEYAKRKIYLKKEIFKNNVMLILDTQSGNVSGEICNNDKNCPKSVKVFGNIFEQKPYIQIPRWGGEFRSLDKKHFIVKLDKPTFLKEFFEFLSFNKNSSVYLDKKRGIISTTYIKSIDLDFKKFQNTKDLNSEFGLDYILYWEDSKITYDNFQFNFEKANVIAKGKEKNLILTGKDGSKLDIKSNNNSLVMRSNNLTGKYVNSIFQKNLLSGGNIEFFMTKDTVDSYQGTVKLKNTTLKDLQFIDNLLLFVNSSPALINPLLGIPALLRLGQDNFSLDGYKLVEGEFQFIYHKARDILEIKNIKTIGNLNNFNGNLEINLKTNQINGNLNVVFLKDFASMIKFIPLVNKIILDKEEEISLPITISGTLEDTSFSIE